MALAIRCSTCNALLKAPDAAAGRTLTCPGCKTPVTFPKPEPPPAPAPLPAPVTPSTTLPDEMPMLRNELSPAHSRVPVSAPVIPDMTLPDEMPMLKDELSFAPVQKAEAFDDFEVIDEKEELDEVLPAEMDEVLPADEEEGLDQLETVDEEEAIEEVEEVVAAGESIYDDSRLLALSLINVRGRSGSIVSNMVKMDNAEYDLIDPDSGKRLGEALEVRSAGQQALRYFVGRQFMDARIEIREGRDDILLAVIRRPPHLWGAKMEIIDADERILATFERAPFDAMTGKTIWIKDEDDRNLLKVEPRFWEGKMLFMTRGGKKVGEMMTEASYEKRLKTQWNPRGGRYYFSFKSDLKGRPLDKLLFLCTGLGIDLFATEGMSK